MEKYSPTRRTTKSQSLSSGKSKCHKPNPLQNNKLNRDTLILLSSQIREIKQKMTIQMYMGKMSPEAG